MPHSDLHEKKKKKNYAVLLALAAFIVLVWAVTMLKMA
jgi:predicted nucleic acid-binding Zn ribbon protein